MVTERRPPEPSLRLSGPVKKGTVLASGNSRTRRAKASNSSSNVLRSAASSWASLATFS